MDNERSALIQTLKEVFAYKAEWLGDRLFEFFQAPSYFPALATERPCVLIGGRGTGKTTVLKGLSYEGQRALRGAEPIEAWPHFGIYIRINTARVRAFVGPEKTDEQWEKAFSHYFNLLVCDEIVRLVRWAAEEATAPVELPETELRLLGVAMRLDPSLPTASVADLGYALRDSIVRFESHLNDSVQETSIPLTVAGAPIEQFYRTLAETDLFRNKFFFVLIDEYENLFDYQQRVVNTLIKHSTPSYTFKVGVRELGWRDRAVLGGHENLTSPADYERIDIAEALRPDRFRTFALDVCNERLRRLGLEHMPRDVSSLLPPLSLDQEAGLLGVEEQRKQILTQLSEEYSGDQLREAMSLPPLQLYLLRYWAEAQDQPLTDIYSDFLSDRRTWDTRYVNYKYAMLFTLRRKRVGLNKYYAGWDTFLQMAGGNIRYFLRLVEGALLSHFLSDASLSAPVTPDRQTTAALEVGRSTLEELEGVDVHGVHLMRLVLGLGRVFQVMARQPSGHAPEVNQFYLKEDLSSSPGYGTDETVVEISALLTSAVTHLALLRSRGTKLLDEASIRHHDYMIHPIFASFFQFSTRRKRKMQLSLQELHEVVHSPQKAIRAILARNRRVVDDYLPDQLLLFEAFYREAG